MLHIKCNQCGANLKGRDVKVEKFYNQVDGMQYREYAVLCPKCGGRVSWDKYDQRTAHNKEKAILKAKQGIKKCDKVPKISQYDAIMRKVGSRTKTACCKGIFMEDTVLRQEFYNLIK